MARQRLWWLSALIFIGLGILIRSNSAQRRPSGGEKGFMNVHLADGG